MATQSVRIGWRPYLSQVVNAVDADATAFISAAGITDLTQAAAINTLVNDLKTYGLWSKMKAIYPFVGGNATSHKFNLKDPRDLDVAYRLVFNGTWTHASTGVKPSSAYADTKFNPFVSSTLNNTHLSIYSRTNISSSLKELDINATDGDFLPTLNLTSGYQGAAYVDQYNYVSGSGGRTSFTNTNTTGFYIGSRTSNTSLTLLKNGVVKAISTTSHSGTMPNRSVYIGRNTAGTISYSSKEFAFASIGDGLNNIESYNFYKAVEKFQTSLGRQMGSNIPTATDIDVQMFLNATQITDTTQINAISTLVSQLKSNNLWDKMRVIYPFVGGTTESHKFNLKDPRDINEAYRLIFNGGLTHDSNGIKGSTTGYANTYFSPSTLSQNNIHFSWYSNTDSLGVKADIGTLGGGRLLGYSINGAGTNWAVRINNTSNAFSTTQTNNTIGFYQVSRTSSTSIIMQKNNTQDTVSSTSATSQSNNIILLSGSGSTEFSDRQLQLVTIGEGLTTTEMNTLKTINDNYKTNLGR